MYLSEREHAYRKANPNVTKCNMATTLTGRGEKAANSFSKITFLLTWNHSVLIYTYSFQVWRLLGRYQGCLIRGMYTVIGLFAKLANVSFSITEGRTAQ